MEQKSQKWLDFRLGRLGTSEISIIRGKSPSIWCDSFELFLRKMGKPYEFSNKYIEIGNRDEEKARILTTDYLKNCQNGEENSVFCRNVYDRTGGIAVNEPNFKQFTVTYKHFPQIFSSFDGIDIQNQLTLELKCPSQATFSKILKNRIPTVPKMYVDQTQGQLMIAKSRFDITTGIFGLYYDQGIYFEDKVTKRVNLIRLILIKTELDVEYCEEMEQICRKYVKMIDNRQWNKNWNDK